MSSMMRVVAGAALAVVPLALWPAAAAPAAASAPAGADLTGVSGAVVAPATDSGGGGAGYFVTRVKYLQGVVTVPPITCPQTPPPGGIAEVSGSVQIDGGAGGVGSFVDALCVGQTTSYSVILFRRSGSSTTETTVPFTVRAGDKVLTRIGYDARNGAYGVQVQKLLTGATDSIGGTLAGIGGEGWLATLAGAALPEFTTIPWCSGLVNGKTLGAAGAQEFDGQAGTLGVSRLFSGKAFNTYAIPI